MKFILLLELQLMHGVVAGLVIGNMDKSKQALDELIDPTVYGPKSWLDERLEPSLFGIEIGVLIASSYPDKKKDMFSLGTSWK